jgi:four helix bundle protein
VPIRDHTDLVAWQLANELRGLILRFTAEPPASRDFKYRSQIDDAISSVCRNLSEGFYKYEHPEFARYVRDARGSLGETQDLIGEGRQKGYLPAELEAQMSSLARRAMVAISRLHRYLRSSRAP